MSDLISSKAAEDSPKGLTLDATIEIVAPTIPPVVNISDMPANKLTVFTREVYMEDGIYSLTIVFRTATVWNVVYIDTVALLLQNKNSVPTELPRPKWAETQSASCPVVSSWAMVFDKPYPVHLDRDMFFHPRHIPLLGQEHLPMFVPKRLTEYATERRCTEATLEEALKMLDNLDQKYPTACLSVSLVPLRRS